MSADAEVKEARKKLEQQLAELEMAVKSLQGQLTSKEAIIKALSLFGGANLVPLQSAWEQVSLCVKRAEELLRLRISPVQDEPNARWEVERLLGALGALMVITRPSPAHELCVSMRKRLREAFGPPVEEKK